MHQCEIDIEYLFPSRNKDGDGYHNSNYALEKTYKIGKYLKFFPSIKAFRKSDFLVIGLKNYNQLNTDLKLRSHVVVTAKDFRHLNNFSFISNFTFDMGIYYKIYEQIIFNYSHHYLNVEKIINRVCPKYLIIKSTQDPLCRLFAYYARSHNIRIICIQHGVYSTLSPPFLLEEDIVDHYIAFDEMQSGLIEKTIPIEKHIYLGVKSFRKYEFMHKLNYKFMLVGTDIERYSDYGSTLKNHLVTIYIKIITKLKIEFPQCDIVYRPHPSESKVPNELLKYVVVKRMPSDLKTSDWVIGVNSSFLKDASEIGIPTIQILHESYPSDRYQDYGYCISEKLDYLLETNIKDYLSSIKWLPYVKSRSLSSVISLFK